MDFFDDDLKGLMGARYEEEEAPKQMPALERKCKPPVAQYEPAESAEEEAFDLWGMVKFPLLFMALVAFLGWTANMELVDPINVLKQIELLNEQITSFELNVDAALSVSNVDLSFSISPFLVKRPALLLTLPPVKEPPALIC